MIDKKDKVIKAAQQIFLKYGYKRVTMNDIANELSISRPGLYLIFKNKDEILKAIVLNHYQKSLEEISLGLVNFKTPKEKIEYIFEIWILRMFDFLSLSPEAKDLMDTYTKVPREIYIDVGAKLEIQIVNVLKPHIKTNDIMSAEKLATIIRHAIRGFKDAAKDFYITRTELKQMISDFLDVILYKFKIT